MLIYNSLFIYAIQNNFDNLELFRKVSKAKLINFAIVKCCTLEGKIILTFQSYNKYFCLFCFG